MVVHKTSKHDNTKTKFQFEDIGIDLTERQKLFCMEYLKCKLNGTQAAINAGYSGATATSQASFLLANVNVQSFINILKSDLSMQIGITAADIAREYAKIGFGNVKNILDDTGNLANLKDLADDAAANVASVQVDEIYVAGESVGQTKRIKLHDKVQALDKLAKMIGADGVTKIATTDPLGNPAVTKVEIVQPKPLDE